MVAVVCLLACKGQHEDKSVVTPWGEVQTDSLPSSEDFTLRDIVANGEMIMLTLPGPETYYDYHGRGLGAQFLLCEKFAQSIGVSLRVELCRDTVEMMRRLSNGEGDVAACLLPKAIGKSVATDEDLRWCGPSVADGKGKDSCRWAVMASNSELGDTLDRWFKPHMLDDVKREERLLLTTGRVKRRVFAPFLNRSTGVISKYDALFRKHAATARWDWRLMAAQCYQESCFDPNARSWAGARGLMQIMPATAAHLGLRMEDIHAPEPNVAAAARYIAELTNSFRDIPSASERQLFVLAAYNGGAFHVRDAMALTRKHGGNDKRWRDVARYMMMLREPAGYNDEVVKYGYMRAGETVDYVDRICERYAQYRGVPVGKISGGAKPFAPVEPRKAKKKHRFTL